MARIFFFLIFSPFLPGSFGFVGHKRIPRRHTGWREGQRHHFHAGNLDDSETPPRRRRLYYSWLHMNSLPDKLNRNHGTWSSRSQARAYHVAAATFAPPRNTTSDWTFYARSIHMDLWQVKWKQPSMTITQINEIGFCVITAKKYNKTNGGITIEILEILNLMFISAFKTNFILFVLRGFGLWYQPLFASRFPFHNHQRTFLSICC